MAEKAGREADLKGAFLAVIASDERGVEYPVVSVCQWTRGIWFVTHRQPTGTEVIFGALHHGPDDHPGRVHRRSGPVPRQRNPRPHRGLGAQVGKEVNPC